MPTDDASTILISWKAASSDFGLSHLFYTQAHITYYTSRYISCGVRMLAISLFGQIDSQP